MAQQAPFPNCTPFLLSLLLVLLIHYYCYFFSYSLPLKMLNMIDPLTYREEMARIPKYQVGATNDEFFMPDALKVSFSSSFLSFFLSSFLPFFLSSFLPFFLSSFLPFPFSFSFLSHFLNNSGTGMTFPARRCSVLSLTASTPWLVTPTLYEIYFFISFPPPFPLLFPFSPSFPLPLTDLENFDWLLDVLQARN